jgi:hypothetical protein
MKYHGSCHCGAITFEVEAPECVEAYQCNCSICAMSGFLHLVVPASKFKPLHGDHCLSEYTFNTHTAKHLFCRRCGIKPYYIPRSNPDGFDVNVRCLTPQPDEITIIPFDGQNWEAHAPKLEELSKDA